MIYLDNGATSFHKPREVVNAVKRALEVCANPGRGGYASAMEANRTVFACREQAAALFSCKAEQVAFTNNATHGLNIAIRTLVSPGNKVVISGFEHNAVCRPLYALGAEVLVAGRKLFAWEDTLSHFEDALKKRPSAAVFTHCSNVFGYILPVEQMAMLCRLYGVPFILDAAQSAGILPISMQQLGADFIAMPGHKGLLGPQGTGLLLCNATPKPLLFGGTGTDSRNREMPQELPERLEAGTMNVPGIAGLGAALSYLSRVGTDSIYRRAHREAMRCAARLEQMGLQVFAGSHQCATVSFLSEMDSEELAYALAERGIAVRAGLHCAPMAHESAGTLQTGTVRVSFGHDASACQSGALIQAMDSILRSAVSEARKSH